jgi:hypothetical protein
VLGQLIIRCASYQPFGWRGRSDRLLIESIDTSTLVGLHDRATSSRSSRQRKAARGDIPGGLEFQRGGAAQTC